MDFVPSDRSRDDADRLLVTPGTERPAPERDGDQVAGGRDDGGDAGLLGAASATIQDWLQQVLGAEEHWESGEPMPSNPRLDGARAPEQAHHPAATATADDRAAAGAGEPTDASGAATRPASGGNETRTGTGGPGAGAGTDTDPALYGAPDDEPVTGRDRFELGISARVRTRRGTDMGTWTDAPGADADRHPVLAAHRRSEEPGHRMPVPPAMAPLVRRLFAHAPPGEDGTR